MLNSCPEEAERVARELIKKDPNYEDAYVKLSNALLHQGRYLQAFLTHLKQYEKWPNQSSKMALGLTALAISDMKDKTSYLKGVEYFSGRTERYAITPFNLFSGDINNLKGEVVRLYLEQGLGDCVMFIPYIKRLAEIVDHVAIVSTDQDPGIAVYEALNCFPENVTLIRKDKAPSLKDDHDVYSLWMFDLLALGLPGEICPPVPRVTNQFGKVGFCWRGNPKHPNDHFRSMPWEHAKKIIEFYGPRMITLQSKLTEEEYNFITSHGGIVDPQIDNYKGLYDLLLSLKRVITVDTFMSHFAGIAGVPCTVLLAVNMDWRWGVSSDKTDWYTNHTLLRQSRCGDWGSILDALEITA
jgi:hypothetical protein